jgi:outer membrane protein assembly factor BamD (BamD/ComL family)
MRASAGRTVVIAIALLLVACASTMKEWRRADSLGSMADYQDFLQRHAGGPYAESARCRLDKLRFSATTDTGTVGAFERFLRRYPESRFADSARGRLEEQVFAFAIDAAADSGTVKACEGYLAQYPNGRFAREVCSTVAAVRREEPARLAFEAARRENTVAAFEGFLRDYSHSSYAIKARHAIRALDWETTRQENTISAYGRFLAHYPTGDFVEDASAAMTALRIPQTTRMIEDAAKLKTLMIDLMFNSLFVDWSVREEAGIGKKALRREIDRLLGRYGMTYDRVAADIVRAAGTEALRGEIDAGGEGYPSDPTVYLRFSATWVEVLPVTNVPEMLKTEFRHGRTTVKLRSMVAVIEDGMECATDIDTFVFKDNGWSRLP